MLKIITSIVYGDNIMSKILIGYVLDEHIGMPLRRNTNYKFRLYGLRCLILNLEMR